MLAVAVSCACKHRYFGDPDPKIYPPGKVGCRYDVTNFGCFRAVDSSSSPFYLKYLSITDL